MKQIFLRHKNGGGKVYGNSALVTPDTFLDRQSSVGDDAEVYGATIVRTAVTDHAIVSSPAIIGDSLISDDVRIFGGTILNSTLAGQGRVWGNPTISDCTLKNVFVFGDAIVEGVSLNAFVRIHAGEWRVAPRYRIIRGGEIEVVISECTEDRGHIGCYCRSYSDWFRSGYRQMIGKRSGWTPKMVNLCYETFKGWR